MEETAVAVTAAVSPDFADTLKHWCELMLVWIGFGTVTGLAAKALMPGRDPGGSIATLVMGSHRTGTHTPLTLLASVRI